MRERRRHPPSLQPLDTSSSASAGAVTITDTNVQIPHHFRCPISLELMSDPVTVSTGQTYDRSSIESWVQSGHVTCPVTRAPLSTDPFTLIPNHTLRRLIQDWCVSHCLDRIPTPKQPADPSLIRHLLHQSTSPSYHHQRISALRRLRQLARESDKNRSLLSSFLIPHNPLLPLLFHHVVPVQVQVQVQDNSSDSYPDPDIRNEALALVAMFPMAEPDSAWIVSDPDRILLLVRMLFDSEIEVRVNSAALLEATVAGSRSDEESSRASVGAADGVFEGVVSLLSDPAAGSRGVRVAVRALFALCAAAKQHRKKAVAAGAVSALMRRLEKGELVAEAERAAAAIEMLVRVPEGWMQVAEDSAAVAAMVGLLAGRKQGLTGGRAAEHAAGALLVVCTASEVARDAAVGAGVVTQLLLLVQSGCTDRAKKKAQLLLKLLRDSWPEDDIANSDDFNGCNDVVRY